jgi:hypothetical protein
VKVDIANGTPIWVSPRRDGGVAVIQGKSHLLLSAKEIPALIDAISKVAGS